MNVDFILADGKAYVLEIGGRSGATCLSEMVSTYYQFDYYEKMLEAALGEKPDFSSNYSVPCAAMLLYSNTEGRIISQTDRNLRDDDIIEVQFDHKIGETVSRFQLGPHRIGHVIVKAGSVDQVVKKLNQVMNNIEIKVK